MVYFPYKLKWNKPKYMHLGERNTHYAQFYIIKTIASTNQLPNGSIFRKFSMHGCK